MTAPGNWVRVPGDLENWLNLDKFSKIEMKQDRYTTGWMVVADGTEIGSFPTRGKAVGFVRDLMGAP